jgi:short subunit dehydrogenase-like uncharacterized protein
MNTFPSKTIAVYGAAGHTGRFVVDEALRRGFAVRAVGRDAGRLLPHVPGVAARIDDADALARAFDDCAVVINCAGPFLDTAAPVARAAIAAGAGYIDVTAEQASALGTLEAFDGPARAAGVAVIPAAGFYGGLADLLASALLASSTADELTVAIALDHWWPTAGTRRTGERNKVPRVARRGGELVPIALPAERSTFDFGLPHGTQAMIELPFSEIVTMSRHLRVRDIRSHLNAASLDEIRDASTPPPEAADARGRSSQRFEMVVQARDGTTRRTATARGQDIYAVTAPLVIEAAARMLAPGFDRRGALAPGEAFDAADFLRALPSTDLEVAYDTGNQTHIAFAPRLFQR